MSTEVIVGIVAALGGGLGQYIFSSFVMPKKEVKEADKAFIDTLIQRVSFLEGKLDVLTVQINELIKENAILKVELEHLRKENTELVEQNKLNGEK